MAQIQDSFEDIFTSIIKDLQTVRKENDIVCIIPVCWMNSQINPQNYQVASSHSHILYLLLNFDRKPMMIYSICAVMGLNLISMKV